jgi:hypothetical protein
MMPSRAVDTPASPDRGDLGSGIPGHHEHVRRKRRQRSRSFYKRWIRPYQRELKNAVLFGVVVVLGYFLWSIVAGR